MRIVLDNLIFFLQKSGGGSVYWLENIKRLDRRTDALSFYEPAGNSENIFYDPIRASLSHPTKKERWNAKLLSLLPFTHEVGDVFVFHSSYYRTATSKKAINIVTIHDFMPELFFKGIKRIYHTLRKRVAIQRADAIVCVSAHTYKDLLTFYPDVKEKPLKVIHLGISTDYYRLVPTVPPKDGEFILFVGRRAHYKNFDFAVRVMKYFPEYELRIVGEELSTAEISMLQASSIRYQLVPNPDNTKLNLLYNQAFCLLYPSSYEGFGIPVLEAMSAGCPIVAQAISSIPEIAGDAGVLVDGLDLEQFKNAIYRLKDVAYRRACIERGFINIRRFNWDYAEAMLYSFYEEVFARRLTQNTLQ